MISQTVSQLGRVDVLVNNAVQSQEIKKILACFHGLHYPEDVQEKTSSGSSA
jgi:hypothetical protein